MHNPVPKFDYPLTNKYCYLILNIGVPTSSTTVVPYNDSGERAKKITYKDHLKIAEEACEKIGVRLKVVEMKDNKSEIGNKRYVIRLPYNKKDNGIILKTAEALIFCLSIFSPISALKELDIYYEFPSNLIQKRNYIIREKLVRFEEAKIFPERVTNFPNKFFFSYGIVGGVHDYMMAWRFVPIVYFKPRLLNAVRFLTKSQDDFYVYPGQINDVIDKPEEKANNLLEQNSLESALLNSFKAIEAVLGDLPGKKNKLALKIKETTNIDPFTLVGYSELNKLVDVIIEMEKYRNKKSAHGSRIDREIRILELMNFQECAGLIVEHAIINLLPKYWDN